MTYRDCSWSRLRHFLTALVVVLGVGSSSGAASPPGEDDSSPRGPDPRRFYLFVNLGPHDAEDEFGLLGHSSYAFQLAGGFGHRLSRRFAGEVELGVMGREHDVSGLDNPTLSIAWLSYSVVFRVPLRKFEPMFGVGVGQGQVELSIVDEDLSSPDLQIADDKGVLFHYRVGFDVAVGKRHRLGMELRRIDCDADLGAFTGGETNIGGTGLLFTYRFGF